MTDTNAPASTVNDTAASADQTATTDTTAAASASATTDTKAAADTGTLIDTAPAQDDKPVAAPADWPSDWRVKLAGDDKKLLERLGRFSSVNDVVKSWRAAEQKISSGDLKKPLPENATPEQLAEFRKENGIPEKPEDYKIELPNGVVLGEADKPLVDSFTAAMHEKNWDNAKINEGLNWYFSVQDQIQQQRAERDNENKLRAEDTLRAEFGPEYRVNLTAVNNLVAGMPENLGANLLNGRMADGTKIGDHPEIIKWMASMSRELNPTATLLPATSGDPGKGLNDRIADIEKLMGDRSSDYWRGSKSAAMQQEYRDLLEAREKLKARAA